MANRRAILHVDMDAFYAAVEVLDEPSLAGRPVIVGGLGPRGVVATASYEARRFGVHSAMPMGRARRLCPQAAFIRPRGARYRELSAQVFAVFREFTPLVEGLSLDEAFLDVSGSTRLFGQPRGIAEQVKARIRERTGLTASVGVAHNKFLAKLASDARKPDGLFVVDDTRVREFLDPMPVSRLWGIGKRTAPRLKHLGILTVGQLRRADPSLLIPVLGNRTEHFLRLTRGEDERPVVPTRSDKSISREETFDVSLNDRDELLAELQGQAEQVSRRLRSKGLLARTVTVKIRDDAFRTATRSRTLVSPTDSTRALYQLARALFERWRKDHAKVSVRLLGVGVSGLEVDPGADHDPGDAEGASPQRRIDAVLDRINERFGDRHVVHGQTMRRRKRD